MAWRAAALAASGAEWSWGLRWERNAGVMEDALDAYCDPIPEPQAFLRGIAHRNSKEEYAGQLWNVPRALASKKMHYRTRLEWAVFLSNGNAASGAPFHEAYPNAVLDDGLTALTARADGEVRHWGARWWTPVPEDFVHSLSSVEFWHYQFTKSSQARRYLYPLHASGYTGHLSTQEIDWIMTVEGSETTLLKRVAGRDPASGGTRETWYPARHAGRALQLWVPPVFLPLPVHLVPPTDDLRDEETSQRVLVRRGPGEEKRQASCDLAARAVRSARATLSRQLAPRSSRGKKERRRHPHHLRRRH